MTRRDFLMKWLLYAAVTLLLVLLQSLVLTHIHLLDIHPFALPLLAGIIAVWEPQRECAFYGLVFGLVCDLTMPTSASPRAATTAAPSASFRICAANTAAAAWRISSPRRASWQTPG